jgi:excinuclease ABC subunit A
LNEVGLGYLKLGQAMDTLSGGESQRLKLAAELASPIKGHCLYVFDEPTTGLHFEDIKKLLLTINKLISRGHSMIVIEHNLDVIRSADWIIDLGPEGGENGGEILATGSPEMIARRPCSVTGRFLSSLIKE